MKELLAKERLVRQARGQDVDRVPSIGGWIGGARNLRPPYLHIKDVKPDPKRVPRRRVWPWSTTHPCAEA